MNKNEELDDQAQMVEVAKKVRERVVEEIPHLQHVIKICNAEHPQAITPLVGMLRSFAVFCNSDDNIKFLHKMQELYSSYAYSKQNKDSHEKHNCKSILKTLNARINDIEVAERKGMNVDFMFDFFPLIRQYQLLLIRGHRPSNDENDICESMLDLVREVAERSLKERYVALGTADKLLS